MENPGVRHVRYGTKETIDFPPRGRGSRYQTCGIHVNRGMDNRTNLTNAQTHSTQVKAHAREASTYTGRATERVCVETRLHHSCSFHLSLIHPFPAVAIKPCLSISSHALKNSNPPIRLLQFTTHQIASRTQARTQPTRPLRPSRL